MNAVQKPSPNFVAGRGAYKPEIVVIHVMDGTLAGTDSWFANPASQASTHYGIGTNGELHQYVQEKDTAWGNGRVQAPTYSLYKPNVNPNAYTISIEHEGNADTVWSEAMKSKSAELIKDVCARWNIPIDRDHIIGHYQIFAGKPNCPARNKAIIDELIARAKGGVSDKEKDLARAKQLLDEAFAIISKYLKV